jgi:putative addiction module component (TIGR02574 family)
VIVSEAKPAYFNRMTLDQIIEEARHLPPDQVVELMNRLTLELQVVPEVEAEWKAETRRRIAQIENGEVQGIPGAEVSARVRKIVGR